MQREQTKATMKTQTFGWCDERDNEWIFEDDICSMREFDQEDAKLDYRKKRENGAEIDNPSRAFPSDGTYSDYIFHHEDGLYMYARKWYRIKYTEGPGDRAWMEEKDRNYLARLKREEESKKQQKEKARTKKKIAMERPEAPTAQKVVQRGKSNSSSTNVEHLKKSSPKQSSQPTLFSNPATNTEDESARTALRIAKRAVMQAKRQVKFSNDFKTALIELVKNILIQNNKELIDKLHGDVAIKMRMNLANKITKFLINDIDTTAVDASDYDFVIEDAIADWKSSDEEWRQICSGMRNN